MAFVHDQAVPLEAMPPPPHPPGCPCAAHDAIDAPRARRVPAWIGPIVVGVAGLSACAYTAINDPNTNAGPFPQCPFKLMTGLDCPGCGMTRGVYALLKGDPITMLNHNLVLLLLLPAFAYGYARWTLKSFGFDVLPRIALKGWQSAAVGIFILAFWVVRNLPGPLSWLNATA